MASRLSPRALVFLAGIAVTAAGCRGDARGFDALHASLQEEGPAPAEPFPGDAIGAADALRRATQSLRATAVHGGYVGIRSLDGSARFGESFGEKATADEIWVQHPGTPTVGEVFLRAWHVTGERAYLRAAREAGRALAWGQRAEGGWDHRADVSRLTDDARRPRLRSGNATFDDGITQNALSFLLKLDRELDEPWLSEALQRAIDYVLEAQYENGAWPQWYPLRGSYHDDYTFNDYAINDCLRVLMEVYAERPEPRILAAIERGGGFLIASRLPAPQAGWAQQYDRAMKPAPARPFEPAALSSAESGRNVATLLDLHDFLHDDALLAPIPDAVAWLEQSRLPDGKWSRFYELGTNRPVYGDRDGSVHYDLAELSPERRGGYSWQSKFGIPTVLERYARFRAGAGETAPAPDEEAREKEKRRATRDARAVLATLDAEGRWVRDGWLHVADYVANASLLLDYLELSRDPSR